MHCQRPARYHVYVKNESYDEPSWACLRRSGFRASSWISGLPESPAPPCISADRKVRTNFEIKTAVGKPTEACHMIRFLLMRGDGRAAQSRRQPAGIVTESPLLPGAGLGDCMLWDGTFYMGKATRPT